VETSPIFSKYQSQMSFDKSLPVQLVMGKFNVCHIEERKLIFRKKEFIEVVNIFGSKISK
jgi:hypothetical protein